LREEVEGSLLNSLSCNGEIPTAHLACEGTTQLKKKKNKKTEGSSSAGLMDTNPGGEEEEVDSKYSHQSCAYDWAILRRVVQTVPRH